MPRRSITRTLLAVVYLLETGNGFTVNPSGRVASFHQADQRRPQTRLDALPFSDVHAILPAMRHSATMVAHSVPHFPFLTNHVIHPLTQGLAQYQELLATNPITTKSITAGVLGCGGDAIAQYKSYQGTEQENNDDMSPNFEFDWKRSLAFLTFGALYTGCFQHFWFSNLNSNIMDWGEDLHIWGHPASTSIAMDVFMQQDNWWDFFDVVHQIDDVMAGLQAPPSTLTLAAAKVSLNQFLVIPLVYMPLFFAITGAVAGMDIDKSIARAQSLYIPLLKRNYLFWLPMQFLQFLVLPNEWQIPFLSVASLCWTVILSSIGGSTQASSTNVAYETISAADSTELPILMESGSLTEEQEVVQLVVDATISEEDLVRVIPNEAGPINEMTDSVRLEDVRKALLPNEVVEAVSDPKVQSTVGGLALGVLAGAADDAVLGAAVGSVLGSGVTPGIALTSAVGAAVAYLATSEDDSEAKTNTALGDEQSSLESAPGHPADSFQLSDNEIQVNLLGDDEESLDNGMSLLPQGGS